MKRPRVSEKVEQSHGVQLLRSLGAAVYVIGHPSPSDGRTFRGTGQTPGIPDVYAFLPARRQWTELAAQVDAAYANERLRGAGRPIALWWEVKAKDGRLRPEQAEFQRSCQAACVEHVVGDFDALIAWLVACHYVKAESFPHYRQSAVRA